MRKLLLIRHAKSSWKFPDLDDHERPLNNRGEGDSFTMARHLSDKDENLDVIYSSTAIRALIFAERLSELTNTTLVPDLSFYTFDVDELMEIIRSLPDSANRVAVVAHNPAITQVANRLTGAELSNIPTAGIAAINCTIDSWHEISSANCELCYFEAPKFLAGKR